MASVLLALPVTESLKGETTNPVRVELWERLQELNRAYVMSPVVLGPTSAGLHPTKSYWHWYFSLGNWKVTYRTRSGWQLGAAEPKGFSHHIPWHLSGACLQGIHLGLWLILDFSFPGSDAQLITVISVVAGEVLNICSELRDAK